MIRNLCNDNYIFKLFIYIWGAHVSKFYSDTLDTALQINSKADDKR